LRAAPDRRNGQIDEIHGTRQSLIAACEAMTAL
jgi:hypothetical protein